MKKSLNDLTKEMDTVRSKIRELINVKQVNLKFNILKEVQSILHKCDEKVK